MTNNALIGTWVTLNHPSIAEIMADAGFDWICVDMEHSVTDYAEAQLLIMAIQGKGVKAFVRVGENNARIIKRVLDAGADGIIVPSVSSKEEAIKAVNAVKYPPLGTRGVGLARAQSYGFDFENYRDNKTKDIKLIVQIEHINAVKELESIINVDGIDGTFIGPYDLSGSMGKPGQYDDEDVKKVLNDYETIAKKHDKLIGYHVIKPDFQLVHDKVNEGYNFIAFSLDTVFLGTKVREQMSQINLKTRKS
jgi:2-keto-3-deoxy-L-rhamnonate aldolase RhmA